MIKPTVGRVVWYRPNGADMHMNIEDADQPCMAQIVYPHRGDERVNLIVHDHLGYDYARTGVVLVQEGGTVPPGEAYCEWMPYQKGQAAKTEQAEAAAGKSA